MAIQIPDGLITQLQHLDALALPPQERARVDNIANQLARIVFENVVLHHFEIGFYQEFIGRIAVELGNLLEEADNRERQLRAEIANKDRANEIRALFRQAIDWWRKEENTMSKIKWGCLTSIVGVGLAFQAKSDQDKALRRIKEYQSALAYFDAHIERNWKADEALVQVRKYYNITYF